MYTLYAVYIYPGELFNLFIMCMSFGAQEGKECRPVDLQGRECDSKDRLGLVDIVDYI